MAFASVLTAQAVDTVSANPACIGSMTLTFNPPLTLRPSNPAITVNGSASCLGTGAQVSWNDALGAVNGIAVDCAEIVALGSGSFNVNGNSIPVSILIAGPTVAQFSIYIDTGLTLVAAGVFTWTDDTTGLANCLLGTSTISSMTLWGALAVVTR